MRVLQINSVCGIGSTGRIATDIHALLTEQGHDSFVAFGRDTPRNCDRAIRIGTRVDNYTHVALTRLLDQHGFGSRKATVEFLKKAERLEPDVIHLHNVHGYYIHVGILVDFLEKTNKPVVWTVRDCWAFTSHCAHFDYVGCDRWRTGCFKCPQKSTYPASYAVDRAERNYRDKKVLFNRIPNLTLVSPSEWLARLIKDSFLREHPVDVINNGIDLSVFAPTDNKFRKMHGLKRKFIILGVASPWTQRKGLRFFVEMASHLEDDEVIVLVGLSRKQVEQLPPGIIGIERTNDIYQLADIYSSSDVFVNPTLEDNFPTTNLEALACGTPVITFDSGGSPEALSKETGIIVERGNRVKLTEAVRLSRQWNRGVISEKCVSHTRVKFGKQEQVGRYIALYNRVSVFGTQ